MARDLFISAPRALGDQIICNGLYRTISDGYRNTFIPIRKSMKLNISSMLADRPDIKYIEFPERFTRYSTYALQTFLKLSNIEIVKIGFAGKDFPIKGESICWDENYYRQLNLSFDLRWDNFYAPRDTQKELDLFEKLGCHLGPYVFAHQDSSRGFIIDEKYFPVGARIVQPKPELKKFSIFDYRLVLENAAEIHCIESSFSALIESTQTSVTLFAHRYARPEAKSNQWHEYTYRKDWNILL